MTLKSDQSDSKSDTTPDERLCYLKWVVWERFVWLIFNSAPLI